MNPTPNVWAHNCDVAYRNWRDPESFEPAFLPEVLGIVNDWKEQDIEFTIEQRIDMALDYKRFDVVQQLVKHL